MTNLDIKETSTELLVSYKPLQITSNIEGLSAWVRSQIEPFRDAELDLSEPERVVQARQVYAGLNKLGNELDAGRKLKVKELMSPIDEFDHALKALVAEVRDSYRTGKNQLDRIAERERETRRTELQEEWAGTMGGLSGLIPYGIIENPSWTNPSYSPKKAERELADKAESVLQAMNTLKATELEFKSETMTVFYKTANLTRALAENTRLIELRKEREDYETRVKELEESRERAYAAITGKPQEEEKSTEASIPPPDMKLHYTLEFIATREQSLFIRDCMNSVGAKGIAFKGVEVNE